MRDWCSLVDRFGMNDKPVNLSYNLFTANWILLPISPLPIMLSILVEFIRDNAVGVVNVPIRQYIIFVFQSMEAVDN
jgi:hypothetical protein